MRIEKKIEVRLGDLRVVEDCVTQIHGHFRIRLQTPDPDQRLIIRRRGVFGEDRLTLRRIWSMHCLALAVWLFNRSCRDVRGRRVLGWAAPFRGGVASVIPSV